MQPSDLLLVTDISTHALSPDGTQVCYETRTPHEHGYHRRLWLAPASGTHDATPLDTGTDAWAPSFSPDGSKIAFYRNGDQAAVTELCVADLPGGVIEVLDSKPYPLGFAVSDRHLRGTTPPAWSPDGTRILYPALVPNTEPGAWHRAARGHYLMDGRGFLSDATVHLFTVPHSPEAVRVSDGHRDHWDASWHPDGTSVVAVRPCAGDPMLQELVRYHLGDGSESVPATGLPHASLPTFSSDGTILHFLGMDPAHGYRTRGRNVSLLQVPLSEDAQLHSLTDPEPVDLDDPQLRPLAPADEPLVAAHRHGSTLLVSAAHDPDTPVAPSRHGAQVLSHDAHNGTVSAVLATAISAGDLYASAQNGTTARITHFADAYHDLTVAPEELWAGQVHCWLYLPPAARGPVPLVLLVHGGPDTQVGHCLDIDAQVLCGRGYAVLMANPRGSAGYGQSHATAINGRLGTCDVDDLLTALGMATDRPEVDGSRVGVTGRSYGGFMTAWLSATRPELFRAAVPECGIYSWDSMVATSDIGHQITELVGANPEDWARCSPLRLAKNVRTPSLIIAYRNDLRTPVEQAQRYYHGLRAHGTETELLVFDGGPHSFSASGPPRARVHRLERITGWFDRYLPGTEVLKFVQ
ncbi:S9 family peptidase [Amycolatopsis jejuensis]|uniref:S9 family peptidase n=1 Tax=Amycolatopsis jejuensis TaxID=330084 RepID=UPI0005272B23|nr:S9 family peptidase [Amycolatopsis jejuensis]